MSEDKQKWEITIDIMLIIGKYLEQNQDFINIIKLNKKYKELVEFYKYNPIRDISLFPNIQTQYFYESYDIINKKKGLFQYIYWFEVNHRDFENKKKNNKIFKKIIFSKRNTNIIGKCVVPEDVTIIWNECFKEKKLITEIILPPNLKLIKDEAFYGCNITYIEIPEGIKQIPKRCFQSCTNLKDVKLPSTLIEIRDLAFENTAIEDITIPEGVITIGDFAFCNCEQLFNIILPKSLIRIGFGAFENTLRLINIKISKNVKFLENYELVD